MDRVIFRTWRTNPGTVIAFLPDNEANTGMVDSYEHIGQHGEAYYYGLIAKTRLSTPEEYQDLFEELKAIGYNLRVLRRLNRN